MKAGIIGAGVIGSGWAARFLLHGWNVCIFDPDRNAQQRLRTVIDRASEHLPQLYSVALPAKGELSFADRSEDAVQDADWVQESLPESLEIKQSLYSDIALALSPTTPLASSTSGFKPSDLAASLACSAQLLVCHPFNPVYLLPAVEVVPSNLTDKGILNSAETILSAIGMTPIVIKQEIDAHIADRLLEALWREALWLIADGVATTTEIDEVMRNGFGLRWAQMGLFETYRIAGGEKGMRHFLAQFGPALAWPWSKLTDVPDLNADLIETIARQSDEQAAGASITELETRRDINLVAILNALKQTNSAAGVLLNKMDEKLRSQAQNPAS